MTNYEYIQSCDSKQLGHFLCAAMETEDKDSCEICPMSNKCKAELWADNGWFHWLKEEKK